MSDLRTEILTQLVDEVPEEYIAKVSQILDLTLHKYNISFKSTELTIYDDSNVKLLKNFLGTKTLEGKSPNTIKIYEHIIKQLLDGLGKPVKDITTDDIRYFLADYQARRGISTLTAENMRAYYSSFFGWCNLEGYIHVNPMLRIKPFKVPKKMIKALSETEIDMLAEQCETLRDRALIEFLYSTGVRASECSGVNITDIDFESKTVIINKGKGNKQGVVYLSDKCMYHLKRYLNEERPNVGHNALWISRKRLARLGVGGIEDIITRLSKKAGLHATPHQFRHSFGTHMAKRGVEIQIIQKAMRHENINTTMVYLEVADRDVKNAHNRVIA